jgi:hypothetical protein
MKQYRITSQNFVHQGETGDPDAFMDPAELNELKRLAGLPIGEGAGGMGDNGAGMVSGLDLATPQAQESGITSPVGSTIANVSKERNALLKQYHVMPGSDFWFMINFTKPKDGESLTQAVERYLKAHPDCLPRPMPGTDA